MTPYQIAAILTPYQLSYVNYCHINSSPTQLH